VTTVTDAMLMGMMMTIMASATTAIPSGGKIFCAMASAMNEFHLTAVW
jgi:hypothetical protein